MRTIQKSYSDAHVSTTHRTRTTISAPVLTFMLEYPAKVLDGNIHAQSKQLFLRGALMTLRVTATRMRAITCVFLGEYDWFELCGGWLES